MSASSQGDFSSVSNPSTKSRLSEETHAHNWRENHISDVKNTLFNGQKNNETTESVAQKLYVIAMDSPNHPDVISVIEECLTEYSIKFGHTDADEIAVHLHMLVEENTSLDSMLLGWRCNPLLFSQRVLQ